MARQQGAASAKVAVRQEDRGHQGPQVEKQPRPAGTDLHPHRSPRAGHLPGLAGSGTHRHPSEPGPRCCDPSSSPALTDPVVVWQFLTFLGGSQIPLRK